MHKQSCCGSRRSNHVAYSDTCANVQVLRDAECVERSVVRHLSVSTGLGGAGVLMESEYIEHPQRGRHHLFPLLGSIRIHLVRTGKFRSRTHSHPRIKLCTSYWVQLRGAEYFPGNEN